MKSVFKLFGWPTICGILLAAVIILAFPRYFSSSTQPQLESGRQEQQQLSYADAVSVAGPSVVSIYTAKRHRDTLPSSSDTIIWSALATT